MELDEIKKRMHQKKLYYGDHQELVDEQLTYLDKLHEYNSLKPSEQEKKQALLKEMFCEIGEGCYIETPFSANWGGKHVHFGKDIYTNFNLVLVDDSDIYVGDNVMIGPNVTLCSATHPIHPTLRLRKAQYNLPVHIERNVWIGANCMIMPGVTIKENSIIGAGSVVTKDIPANVVALGAPCRVVREINEHDHLYFNGNQLIDIHENLDEIA